MKKPTRESVKEIRWRIDAQLETAKVKLRTYTGELMKVIGTLNVIVKYEKQEVELQTIVLEGGQLDLTDTLIKLLIDIDWLIDYGRVV